MMSYNMCISKSTPVSPTKPASKPIAYKPAARNDAFHIVHNVPMGNSPYVKAKHVQLVDKDPDRAIALFWEAINSGDRVDSALKDMAIVMKQKSRPHEAIEVIKSLRSRCSDRAQESLDNVLLDLYKGNLGWAYMQQSKFLAAEAVYRKALLIESDVNKVCNLGICLMKQGRLEEAKSILRSVILPCNDRRWTSDSHLKSFERAQEMMEKLESSVAIKGNSDDIFKQVNSFAIPGYVTDAIVHDSISRQPQPGLRLHPCRITKSALESKQVQCNVDPSISGPLVATSGFGLAQSDATPDMTGNFRRQAWLQGGSCSGTSGGWIEDDLYYTSPDESSDGSDIHEWPLDFKYYLNDTENDETQFSVQNNLRMRSESAIDLKRELCNSQLGLNCEADAYFPTSTVTAASTVSVLAQGQEEQPFNSTSTSSQAELLRHLATPMRETDVTKQVQYQQLLLRGLSPCPIGAGKRYEAIAPGNPLDFTINPDEFDFNRVTSRIKVTGQICEFSSVREFAEGFNSTVNVSAFEMNLRKQRRLRVFQEMAMSQTIQAV